MQKLNQDPFKDLPLGGLIIRKKAERTFEIIFEIKGMSLDEAYDLAANIEIHRAFVMGHINSEFGDTWEDIYMKMLEISNKKIEEMQKQIEIRNEGELNGTGKAN